MNLSSISNYQNQGLSWGSGIFGQKAETSETAPPGFLIDKLVRSVDIRDYTFIVTDHPGGCHDGFEDMPKVHDMPSLTEHNTPDTSLGLLQSATRVACMMQMKWRWITN